MKSSNSVPVASVVVNNRNYGHFLNECIDSALQQSYKNTEVVVVDDGSSDSSRSIISSYGDRIKTVIKSQGGQASALNAGICNSRGDVIFLLDADDVFMPDKIERIIDLHLEVGIEEKCMISHRLKRFGDGADDGANQPDYFWHIAGGRRNDGSFDQLCTPQLAYDYARRHAFVPYLASPTSGMSITRALAEAVIPLPEAHDVGADCLVARAAVLSGVVYGIGQVYAMRRLHERNHSIHSHKHLEDERFLTAMDRYLNRILVESGREAAISFFDSRYAAGYHQFRRSPLGLLRVALKTCSRNRSLDALRFAARQCSVAIHLAWRRTQEPQKSAA